MARQWYDEPEKTIFGRYDETTEVYPHGFVDLYQDWYYEDDELMGLHVFLQAELAEYNKSIGRDWDAGKAWDELCKQFWRFEMGDGDYE